MITALILNPPVILTSRFSLKWRLLLRFFWISGLALMFFLFVLYLFQINVEESERYSVQKYESMASGISKENKEIEINALGVNSLNNVLSSISDLNFEKAEKVQYIKVINNQVVAK